MSEVFKFPIEIRSPNRREHWGKSHARNKKIKLILKPLVVSHLPVVVVLTRHSNRFFDDDNLVAAFKGVRDALADKLIPGLSPGRADGDPRIKWVYEQKKSKEKYITVEFKHE